MCYCTVGGVKKPDRSRQPCQREYLAFLLRVTGLHHGWRPSALNNSSPAQQPWTFVIHVTTLQTKVSRGGPSDLHSHVQGGGDLEAY